MINLIEIYLWLLNDSDTTIPILDRLEFSPADIDEAIKLATDNHKKFVAQKRLTNLAPADAENHKTWFSNDENYQRLLEFLNFCKKNSSTQILICTLDYLMHHPDGKKIKLGKIRQVYEAINTVHQEEPLSLSRNSEIDEFIQQCYQVKKNLDELKSILNGIPLKSGITVLFTNLMSEPVRFAAAVLWLLENKASVDFIFESGLLHEYYQINCLFIDKPNNDIGKLYHLLSIFVSAEELVVKAGQTSARSQQDIDTEKMFTYASLSAPSDKDQNFTVIKIARRNFSFIPVNEQQFDSLYGLFGLDFLSRLLRGFVESKNPQNIAAYKKIFKTKLNPTGNNSLSLDELSLLTQEMVQGYDFQVLKILQYVVDPDTIVLGLQKKKWELFHIARFTPRYMEKIDQDDLETYFQEIKEKASEVGLLKTLQILSSLFLGIEQLGENNKLQSLKSNIFQSLIKITLEDPINEDDPLVREIFKKEQFYKIVVSFASELDKRLDEMIHTALMEQGLTIQVVHLLTDQWQQAASQFSLLKRIDKNLESTFPKDKYQFHAQIAQKYKDIQGQQFRLDELLQCLQEASLSKAWTKEEKERNLIEMLVAIDDEKIIGEILTILESEYGQDWLINNPAMLLERAIRNSNLGLTRLLIKRIQDDTNRVNIDSIRRIMSLAPELDQLEIVEFLTGLSGELKPDIKYWLERASFNHKWRVVNFLISSVGNNETLDKSDLRLPLNRAAEQNQKMIVDKILELELRPNDQMIREAMYQAAAGLQFEMVKHLYSEIEKTTIDETQQIFGQLITAVRGRAWAEVTKIMQQNKFSQLEAGLALLETIHFPQLTEESRSFIKAICELNNSNSPSKTEIDKFLEQVSFTVSHYSTILPIFLGMNGPNKPSQTIIEKLFFSCIEQFVDNEVLVAICNMQTENKLSKDAVDRALVTAARKGAWETVRILLCVQGDNRARWSTMQDEILPKARKENAIEVVTLIEQEKFRFESLSTKDTIKCIDIMVDAALREDWRAVKLYVLRLVLTGNDRNSLLDTLNFKSAIKGMGVSPIFKKIEQFAEKNNVSGQYERANAYPRIMMIFSESLRKQGASELSDLLEALIQDKPIESKKIVPFLNEAVNIGYYEIVELLTTFETSNINLKKIRDANCHALNASREKTKFSARFFDVAEEKNHDPEQLDLSFYKAVNDFYDLYLTEKSSDALSRQTIDEFKEYLSTCLGDDMSNCSQKFLIKWLQAVSTASRLMNGKDYTIREGVLLRLSDNNEIIEEKFPDGIQEILEAKFNIEQNSEKAEGRLKKY